jgi:hypothetical protein
MDKKIVITKVDDAPKEIPKEGGRKTVKTFPRGILKRTSKLHLKGVTDPAKSPPLKKGMKKHTLRLLTEKGMKKHRKTMKNRIAKMSDAKVKQAVQTAGLVTNPNTPTHISRQILDNAISAGFISS